MTTPAEPAPRAVTISLSDDEHVVLLDALVVLIDDLVENKRPTEIAMALYQRIGAIEAAPAATPGQDAGVTITMGREAAEWSYREICGDNSLTPTPFHLCSEVEAAFSLALGIVHSASESPSPMGLLVQALAAVPSRADQPDSATTSGQPEGATMEMIENLTNAAMYYGKALVQGTEQDALDAYSELNAERAIVEAAVSHVPPADSLDAAIAECESKGLWWSVARDVFDNTRYVGYVQGGKFMVPGNGDTPLEALSAALAAAGAEREELGKD